ncbi:MAG: FHA domain-containing protein, partial [Phycisphaerae bacterium]|nr:FHA domain-containing protein [Phycisphaerae bacterium]
MAAIQVIQGPDKGRAFSLGDDETIIGRESETAPLNDGTVSRRHARLWEQKGRWMLEDLGSANGTFLNGMRV